MIKFFRKIRQKLLSENKFSKYILYAIGEIVLVVIGILIALQINNSNELRKQKEEEAIIISNIKEDLIATRLNFLEAIKKQTDLVFQCRDLINMIESKDYTVNPNTISSKISRGALGHYRVEAVMGSYDALIGSGKISIIKNKELVDALATFSAQYKAGYEDEFKTETLWSLMTETTKGFFPALSPKRLRWYFGNTKIYSKKETEKAIKNLYENEAFLAYLAEKIKWANIRLHTHQKALLKSLNEVLYQLNVDEVILEKELYSKYVGNYMNETSKYKMEITYSDDKLYLKHLMGGKSELLQINKSSFTVLSYILSLDFNVDENEQTTFTINGLTTKDEPFKDEPFKKVKD